MSVARRFEGRTAIVLGGGADGPPRDGEHLPIGNGRAIALRLAAEGARVAVTDIDLDRARETVDAMAEAGIAIQADLADEAACRTAIDHAVRELGAPDVLVANAAIGSRTPLRAQTVADFDRGVAVNVRGHWVSAQAALEHMLDRGRGSFVFVGSTAGVLSSGSDLAYEASKAAQLAVMRHIAVRYADRGVRSNAVVLGVIDSTMVRRVFGTEAASASARDELCPMRRQGTPEEVAAATAFLASDDAGFVNGHSLVVDGGVSASWPTPSPVHAIQESDR
jgi:NAD(P)-dependent dehydrogenase (short-subunit alcohol dehydrogenase family)